MSSTELPIYVKIDKNPAILRQGVNAKSQTAREQTGKMRVKYRNH